MKFLTFDTETTGLPKKIWGQIDDSSNWPHIVQFSWMLYDNETNTLLKENDIIKINPDVDLSESSINIHGITREMCNRQGIPIKNAIVKFQNALKEATVIIAHNLNFDKRLLMAECHRNNMRHEFYNVKTYYCTMKNSIDLCKIEATNMKTGMKYFKYPKLSDLHEHLFKTVPKGTHDALVDILICFRCYYKMVYNEDIAFKNRQIGGMVTKMCKI